MTKHASHNKPYISNPFKLMFDGFGHMYSINQNLTIVLLVIGALGSFSGWGGGFPSNFDSGNTSTSGVGQTIDPLFLAAIITLVVVVVLIFMSAVIFLTTMYSGMAAYTAWNTAQNKTVTFESAFKTVLQKFWRIVFINLIVGLKVFGGLLLFIVPGIRAMLRYQMVLMPVFESDANHKQAIATSKAITKGHLIEIFGLSVAGGIIPLIGGTLKIGGYSIMYPQLKQVHQTGEKPKIHWLNYLGFILLGAVLLTIPAIALMIWLIIRSLS